DPARVRGRRRERDRGRGRLARPGRERAGALSAAPSIRVRRSSRWPVVVCPLLFGLGYLAGRARPPDPTAPAPPAPSSLPTELPGAEPPAPPKQRAPNERAQPEARPTPHEPGEEGTAGDPPGAAEPGPEAATATDGAALDLLGRVATP